MFYFLVGPRSKLSLEREQQLCDWLVNMAKIGYGISKKELPLIVKSLLDKCGEQIFANNLPTICWVYRFLNRWPTLSSRLPENLGHQRAIISEPQIREWFKSLETYLDKEHNISATDFFCEENASRVFNLDESGFPLAGTNGKLKVITTRGTKNVYRICPDTREQITVLGCVSASGFMAKPFVIFPGIRPNYNFSEVNPDDYHLGTNSPNGWISADCFFGWLANKFYPEVRDSVTFPIVLFMDGHTSHINLAVSQFCREKNIILFCFPAHASHLMQPLDVSVYGPLKKFWNEALDDFRRQFKGLAMSRAHFFKVFDKAWKRAVDSPANIKAGFRKCGLVPFSPDAVAYDKLIVQPTVINSSAARNEQEQIGMFRMFNVVESQFPPDMKKMFEQRYANEYDLEDETDNGVLYRIYKGCKDLLNKKDSRLLQVQQEVGLDVERPEASPATPTRNDDPTPRTPTPSANILLSNNEDDAEIDLIDLNIPGPSTSRNCNSSFDHWEESPFKSHLKISDSLIITRKITKTKPKLPPAISGNEYLQFLQKKQDEKKKQLELKEERKKKREMKKAEKNAGTKRTLFTEESEESGQEMEFDDEESIEMEEENTCFGCGGNDEWDQPNVWIGCSTCSKWFHKACISEDVMTMTEEELLEYNYYCKSCEQKQTRRTLNK